jgi:hypothetical protein
VTTGFVGCNAQAPVTVNSGDDDGYEDQPGNACADGGPFAEDRDSGTTNNAVCDDPGKDRHTFYDYGIAPPAGLSIQGVEIRLDAWADNSNNDPAMCVELSWDGGLSWTAAKTTPILGTSESSYVLGSPSDDWGHAWTPAELSDGSLIVRITDIAIGTDRRFRLDWVAVSATYLSFPTPASEVSLSAAQDTRVIETNPDTNFGANPHLTVGGAADHPQRSFLSVDVSALPAGATIVQADLVLCYASNPQLSVIGHQHELRKVVASWIELGMTWNNQPGVVAGVTDTINVPLLGGCVTFDVTGDVQSWVDGAGNFGWRIGDQNEEFNSGQAFYASRDNYNDALRPVLNIQYLTP